MGKPSKRKPKSEETPEQSTELLPLDHDGFFTETFKTKRLAKAFLRITLPAKLLECLDLDGLTAEPRHITDEVFKELITDVVYRVPIKGTNHHVDFFVFLEHKSFNDRWTIFQLWVYVLYVCLQEFRRAKEEKRVNADYRLPPIIAIILHHGESRFTGKTELSELFLPLPGIEEYLPKLQAVLYDLSTLPDDEMPDDPDAPELKLVLMALKLVFRKDVSTKIKTILEELQSISDDPLLRRVVRWAWCYLVNSAEHMEGDYEVLYDTIKKIVEVDSMPTMLEKWTAKAKAEERVIAKAETVLTLLRTKFHRIPKGVERAVRQMSDPIALDSLAAHILGCGTLDDFATALK